MALLLLAGVIGFQPDDSAHQVDFLRVSYKANKETFTFGTFRFEYTRGSCASLADAEAGAFTRAITEQGLYVFEGKNARYDLIAEPEDIASATTWIDDEKGSSFAWSYRMLTDGKVTLLDYLSLNKPTKSFIHRPEVYPRSAFFYQDVFFQFPLWLGVGGGRRYDLFHDLTEVKEGKASLLELDFDSQLDRLKVCKLSYRYAGGQCTYWIDLSRGCVPLRIAKHNDQDHSDSTFIFSDLEHVSGAGWLPRRRLHVFANGNVFDRIVVTEIDVQKKPPSSAFQLDFPEPVHLIDRAKGLVYTRGKTWSLLKLPDPSSPGTKRVGKSAPMPLDELPGEIESGTRWILILTAVLAVSSVVGSSVILKRRKQRLGKAGHG